MCPISGESQASCESPEQSACKDWRDAFSRRVNELSDRQVELSAALAENTEATQRIETSTGELVQILNSWKGAMQVLDMVGKVAKPIAAIVAMCSAIWGLLQLGGGK